MLQIQQIDLDNEQIYFLGSNRESGDPYFQYLYRVNFDGSQLVNLTPEIAHHQIGWSDSAEYFSDVFSTPTTPAVAVVRNTSGELQMALEETDISALVAGGWVAPEPFVVKARDQITDIYGLLYKPSNFDETKSYPVLNYLYPGRKAVAWVHDRFVPRAVTSSLWPSLDSSLWSWMLWVRLGDRSPSTTPTMEIWAIVACLIRSKAFDS